MTDRILNQRLTALESKVTTGVLRVGRIIVCAGDPEPETKQTAMLIVRRIITPADRDDDDRFT